MFYKRLSKEYPSRQSVPLTAILCHAYSFWSPNDIAPEAKDEQYGKYV
jgi:hypothetical protein